MSHNFLLDRKVTILQTFVCCIIIGVAIAAIMNYEYANRIQSSSLPTSSGHQFPSMRYAGESRSLDSLIDAEAGYSR